MEYWLTEHLRLNGVYWGLTALHLLDHPTALPRDKTIDFVLACQNPDGGFGAARKHDSHILYTTSAIQILATVDALTALDSNGGRDKVGRCKLRLNRPSCTLTGQISLVYKIVNLAPSLVTSGARRTLASFIALSLPCP